MPKFEIEIGENCKPSVCHCCGQKSNVGHGFIYKEEVAYAVYYVGWAAGHPDKTMSFALAIGEWDDESTIEDRICFGLEAYEEEKEILFRVIEAAESPWENTDLLGKMISLQEALKHHLLQEVFIIIEYIIRNHLAVRKYLAITK